MIKQIAIAFLLLCGAPAWAQTFPELTGRVVDTADLLPPDQEAELAPVEQQPAAQPPRRRSSRRR